MIQVGESSILDITDKEFETYLKVLRAMQYDGVGMFMCTEQNLEQADMEPAVELAIKTRKKCVEMFNSVAVASAAYYVRMKQRQAEKIDPLTRDAE